MKGPPRNFLVLSYMYELSTLRVKRGVFTMSLKNRILSSLAIAVVTFVVLNICYTTFVVREDAFSLSLTCALSWAVGYFVAKTINALKIELVKRLLIMLVLIAIIFATAEINLFVFPECERIIEWITISFHYALIWGICWTKDEKALSRIFDGE